MCIRDSLSLLEHHEAPVHLLLSDVVMPGMSGRQLAEQLVQTRPEVKVLYMSGYTDSFIAGHGVLEAGTHLLHKPFTEEILTRRVRGVLDSRKDAADSRGIVVTPTDAYAGAGVQPKR